jgi:hypothetical protein
LGFSDLDRRARDQWLDEIVVVSLNGDVLYADADIDGTIVGTAMTTYTGPRHAVIWVPQGP